MMSVGSVMSDDRDERSVVGDDTLLIVGIGNTLRRDDGAGVAAVERLEAALGDRGARFVTTHQLLPELAEDLAHARDLVFIDARVGVTAGRVTIDGVDDTATAQGAGHYVTPGQLLAIARLMYGASQQPRAHEIGIGAANMDHGQSLSPVVHHAVSRVVDMVYRAVLRWTCDGQFVLPAIETAEPAAAIGAACDLKWSRYIDREMHDA